MFDNISWQGSWTEEERSPVIQSIEAAEQKLKPPYRDWGERWICIKEVMGRSVNVYIASRIGLSTVPGALTAYELAEKIRGLRQLALSCLES